MAKSAIRRHHNARLKKKRKGYWGRDNKWSTLDPLTPQQLNMVVRTPKNCGCFMCSRNKRIERGGKTFYEVRLSCKAQAEMKDQDFDGV